METLIERATDRNTSDVAHDFNNALATVVGFAELARMTIPPDDPAFAAIEGALRASARARDLARQLVELANEAER
jgi:two-component system, cell cycle sensor histidine kinase and response regulator CckA